MVVYCDNKMDRQLWGCNTAIGENMPTEKNLKPRTAFKHFINYLHAEVLDFDKITNDDMFETYMKAMQFVAESAGNSDYSPFYKEDGQLLLYIQTTVMSMSELCEIQETTFRSMAPKMSKLINLGYVSSFKENKETFYKITPFGLKFLEDLVNDPKSVLYD